MEMREFAQRLAELRMQKGVSARDMSLSIGQSAGYINNIENCLNYPSMTAFFYICEYLDVTPQEFFQVNVHNPAKLNTLLNICKDLNDGQIDNIIALARDLKR
ncbi:MAG: helix-turn-helix transcriptional regulator [Clostridia bacterium]|nr:helix-turn-helix transcriptional regulator [Clostridia bacterium]